MVQADSETWAPDSMWMLLVIQFHTFLLRDWISIRYGGMSIRDSSNLTQFKTGKDIFFSKEVSYCSDNETVLFH